MFVLYVVMGVLLAVAVLISYRNPRVFSCQVAMLRQIRLAATVDIFAESPWEWGYEEYDRVSYWKMLFSVKPIKPESYYDDLSFLDATASAPRSVTQVTS